MVWGEEDLVWGVRPRGGNTALRDARGSFDSRDAFFLATHFYLTFN